MRYSFFVKTKFPKHVTTLIDRQDTLNMFEQKRFTLSRENEVLVSW